MAVGNEIGTDSGHCRFTVSMPEDVDVVQEVGYRCEGERHKLLPLGNSHSRRNRSKDKI